MFDRQAGKTVFAVASGRGIAGVCVIRISGPHCAHIIRSMSGKIPTARVASLLKLISPHTKISIDHALVLWFPGPASFTGEDVLELQVHGGPAIVKLLLEELSSFEGLESAKPGIFSRRAFLNGKMDLTQIEGLADLLHAETEFQRQQAQNQFSGIVGKKFQIWRHELKRALAYYEAFIDFADEDLGDGVLDGVNNKIELLKEEISRYLEASKSGERLRNGFRVVLTGEVNVGKSTLLNILAKREVAIVSDQAGTTRDVIEVHMDLKGLPVVISDTAGMRDTDGVVEKEGIRRAKEQIKKADLVLWISDRVTSETILQLDVIKSGTKVIKVLNKIDQLDQFPEFQGIGISAKNGTGVDLLIDSITVEAEKSLAGGVDALVVRERHKLAIRSCLDCLNRNFGQENMQIDLLSEDLREAMGKLGDIVGRVGVEEVLDTIFSDFCIGK